MKEAIQADAAQIEEVEAQAAGTDRHTRRRGDQVPQLVG